MHVIKTEELHIENKIERKKTAELLRTSAAGTQINPSIKKTETQQQEHHAKRWKRAKSLLVLTQRLDPPSRVNAGTQTPSVVFQSPIQVVGVCQGSGRKARVCVCYCVYNCVLCAPCIGLFTTTSPLLNLKEFRRYGFTNIFKICEKWKKETKA